MNKWKLKRENMYKNILYTAFVASEIKDMFTKDPFKFSKKQDSVIIKTAMKKRNIKKLNKKTIESLEGAIKSIKNISYEYIAKSSLFYPWLPTTYMDPNSKLAGFAGSKNILGGPMAVVDINPTYADDKRVIGHEFEHVYSNFFFNHLRQNTFLSLSNAAPHYILSEQIKKPYFLDALTLLSEEFTAYVGGQVASKQKISKYDFKITLYSYLQKKEDLSYNQTGSRLPEDQFQYLGNLIRDNTYIDIPANKTSIEILRVLPFKYIHSRLPILLKYANKFKKFLN